MSTTHCILTWWFILNRRKTSQTFEDYNYFLLRPKRQYCGKGTLHTVNPSSILHHIWSLESCQEHLNTETGVSLQERVFSHSKNHFFLAVKKLTWDSRKYRVEKKLFFRCFLRSRQTCKYIWKSVSSLVSHFFLGNRNCRREMGASHSKLYSW